MMMPPESLGSLQAWARTVLRQAGVATPSLDARLLLQHATGLAHPDLIAEPEQLVPSEAFRAAIARRVAREPVSRIMGTREFYGRPFFISPATLDPRPDTETLIEEALSLEFESFLDVGTGSGIIGLTLLAERPALTGLLTDVSADALAMAQHNARALSVAARARFLHTSWFEGITGPFDAIVSNPPYIARADIAGLEADVRTFDPMLALDGGADGLDAYRALACGAGAILRPGGLVCVEAGAGQGPDLEDIFRAAGFVLIGRRRDLGGHERAFSFRQNAV